MYHESSGREDFENLDPHEYEYQHESAEAALERMKRALEIRLSATPITVYVKDLRGMVIQINARTDTTVESLKLLYEEKTGAFALMLLIFVVFGVPFVVCSAHVVLWLLCF